MKSHVTSAARSTRPSFMQKIVALGAAALLAVSALGMPAAWASETAQPTSLTGKIAPRDLTSEASPLSAEISRVAAMVHRAAGSSLPEQVAESASAHSVDSPTMTFYYYELVHYEDPEVTHPNNQRLLYTRTVENLNVGDVLDTWDYVDDIDGYFFFDAWPAKPVVSEDESQNIVELFYMNPELNAYMVNYYRVSDGSSDEAKADAAANEGTTVEEFDGLEVRFDHMGADTVDGQYFNKKIVGADIAPELESMLYVDSYPQSIRVQTNHEDNVINLLYADDHLTLPDHVEVPDHYLVATPDAAPEDSESAPNSPTHAVPGTGTAAGTTAVGNTPGASAAPQQPAEADDAWTTKVTERLPERELAQTDDAGAAVAPLFLVLMLAGGTALLVSRRPA